jgi:DSF synthase
MIMSGKLYEAEELYELGLIDILADKGEGELELYKYIKAVNRSPNSYKAMAKVKDLSNKTSYQELVDIANIWADTALDLTPKDLKMMERLVNRQNRKMA